MLAPPNFHECAGTQSCRAFISRINSTVITRGGDQVGSAQACRLAATRLLQPLRTSADRSRISSGVGSDNSRSKDLDFLDTSLSRLKTIEKRVTHVALLTCSVVNAQRVPMTVTCEIAGVFDYSLCTRRRGLPRWGKMPLSSNRGDGAFQTALPQ